MKHYKVKNYARQAGMTLIELSVVLLILVGLAGLLIPYVSGFVEKTHDSTTLSNLSTLDTVIPQFRTVKNTYPDGLETLIDSGAAATDAFGNAGAGGTAVGSGVYSKLFKPTLFKAEALGASQLTSLKRAGINEVHHVYSNTTDATFKSIDMTLGHVDTAATTTVAKIGGADWSNTNVFIPDTGTMAALSPYAFTAGTVAQHLAYTFGGHANKYNTVCNDYIAFGIGQDNQLIGASLQTAPVHFSANGDSNPTEKYSRYLAVFEVQKSTQAGCKDQIGPAKFIGTAMNMDFAALIGTPSSQAWVAQQSKAI